jgi:hypothetical protein
MPHDRARMTDVAHFCISAKKAVLKRESSTTRGTIRCSENGLSTTTRGSLFATLKRDINSVCYRAGSSTFIDI